MKRPLIDGFAGYGDGREIQLSTADELPDDHPAVVARPDLFETVTPDAPTPPTRPRGRRG